MLFSDTPQEGYYAARWATRTVTWPTVLHWVGRRPAEWENLATPVPPHNVLLHIKLSRTNQSRLTMHKHAQNVHIVFIFLLLGALTESCPDRYWGASLSMLGLIGDVTEMDGRSIFWDSKELEPDGVQTRRTFTFVWMKESRLQRRKPTRLRSFLDVLTLLGKGFCESYLIPVVHVCCLVSLEYPCNAGKKRLSAHQTKGGGRRLRGVRG